MPFIDFDAPAKSGGTGAPATGGFVDFDAPAPKQPKVPGVSGTLAQGARGTMRSIGAAADLLQGDNTELADAAAAQQAEQRAPRLQAFLERIQTWKQDKEAAGEEPGWWDTAKELAGATWENPKGAGLLMVEQLPNSVAALLAAGGGAVAGGLVGGPPGAVAGGIAGLFAANTALETGGKALERAAQGPLTEDERAQTLREGVTKGSVITAVDAVTLGASGFITGTARRAVEGATVRALTNAGVDVTSEAARLAARQNPQIVAAVRRAQDTAFNGAMTLGQRAARVGAAGALETFGEGVGEYLGEYAATGRADKMEAMIEAFTSAGQSAAEIAFTSALNRNAERKARWQATEKVEDQKTAQAVRDIAAAPTPDAAIAAAAEAAAAPVGLESVALPGLLYSTPEDLAYQARAEQATRARDADFDRMLAERRGIDAETAIAESNRMAAAPQQTAPARTAMQLAMERAVLARMEALERAKAQGQAQPTAAAPAAPPEPSTTLAAPPTAVRPAAAPAAAPVTILGRLVEDLTRAELKIAVRSAATQAQREAAVLELARREEAAATTPSAASPNQVAQAASTQPPQVASPELERRQPATPSVDPVFVLRIRGQLPSEMTVRQLQHLAGNPDAQFPDWQRAVEKELKRRERRGETFLGKTVDQLSDTALGAAEKKGRNKALRDAAGAERARRAQVAAALEQRLKSPGVPETLKALADEAGWAQRGGHMIRKTEDYKSINYTEVVGRTKWIPRAEWWPGRPVEEGESYYKEAVRAALAGDKLSAKQRDVVHFLLGLAEDEMTSTEAPGVTPDQAAEVQAAVDTAPPAPDAWHTMTKEQKDDHLQSLFPLPGSQGEKLDAADEGARPQAAEEEVGPREREPGEDDEVDVVAANSGGTHVTNAAMSEGRAAGFLGTLRDRNPYNRQAGDDSRLGELASEWDSGWVVGNGQRARGDETSSTQINQPEPKRPALELKTQSKEDLKAKEQQAASGQIEEQTAAVRDRDTSVLTSPEGTAPARSVADKKVPTQQENLFSTAAQAMRTAADTIEKAVRQKEDDSVPLWRISRDIIMRDEYGARARAHEDAVALALLRGASVPDEAIPYQWRDEKDGFVKRARGRGALPDVLRGAEGDIALDTARAAFTGTSHDPERRGRNAVEQYVSSLKADYEHLSPKADSDEKRSVLDRMFGEYRSGYRQRYAAWLSAHSRVMSAMIAGPARFPVESNRKKADSADRRRQELADYRKRMLGRIVSEIAPQEAQAVSSDGPNAIEKLKAKLASAEALQERMRALNDAHRRFLTHPASLDSATLSGEDKERVRTYKPAYSWEPHPFPPYRLQNNNAEIKRLRERLAQLTVRRAENTREQQFESFRVVDNVDANRLQVFFPSKPDEATRSKLKDNGFRWAPSEGAWQRFRGQGAEVALERALGVTLETNNRGATGKGEAMFSRAAASSERGAGMTESGLRAAIAKAFSMRVADRLLKTGIVTPLKRQADLPETAMPYLREGDTVYGYYDKATDRTYAVLENLSESQVRGLVLHEVGVHYGFQRMLGLEKYAKVMKRLDLMRKAGNRNVQAAYETAKAESAAESQVEEETLAYLVQHHPQMSLVQEIISAIKAFLYREFGIGGGSLTEADMAVLARAAVMKAVLHQEASELAPAFGRESRPRSRVEHQPGFDITPEMRATMERGLPLFARARTRDRSNIDTALRRMGRFVDEHVAGQLKDSDTQILGPTPTTLQALGAPGLHLQIDGGTVRKVLEGKHRHSMTADILKQLPEALYDPLAVFDSPGKSGEPGMVVLTEMTDKRGAPVIAAVHLDKSPAGRLRINDVAGAYGPEEAGRGKLTSESLLYYRNKESLELPTTRAIEILAAVVQATRDSGRIVKTEADVVKEYGPKFSRAGVPDIRFSRAAEMPGNRASWNSPEPSRLDNLLYTMQDRQVDTKRVQEAIRKTSQDIADAKDVYLQEELFHGRAATGVQRFLDKELKPLLGEMSARGIRSKEDIAAFEKYLHARHAEEANDVIARRNPKMPDGGSGMDTADAKSYLSNLDPAKKRAYEALATRIDAINAKTRQTWVDYGLSSQEDVDVMEAAYKHYVPLHREDMDNGPSIGQGVSVRGPSTKKRTGSKRVVVDIIANIAMQRERAIVRGEKNRVATALVGLAQANPNDEFWQIDKPPMIRYVDERSGLVTSAVDPLYKSRENVVMARIPDADGKIVEHSVTFNEQDERALRMSKALKNLDMDQLGEVLGFAAKGTRFLASMNTQYNPIFGIVNLTRDTQGAIFNLSTTAIRGKQAEVLRNTLSALRGIYIDIRNTRAGKPTESAWADLWEEFQEVGGQTGFRDMFRTSNDRGEAIERELKRVTEGKAKGFGRAVFDWLSDYNNAMENAVRLAAYKVAKESGMTNERAASLAKNLTVNFNRKGQAATQVGALYAFFNASVQGTARLAETLNGPAGRKIILGGLTLGSLQALALAAGGFGDGEPPEFVRERNVIIPIGDGKYLTVPMPLGLHILPNIGRIGTEFALAGFKNPSKKAAQMANVFAEAFNPVGNAGWSLQTISPTVVDPIAALAENRDWTGKPIAREDLNKLSPTPGHTRAKDTASAFSKAASQAFNWASGGTNYKPGVFSPTPDQIDYLIGQVSGGVGREAIKLEQTIASRITGEELPTYKIPLIGRLYGDTTGQSSQANAFYANLKELNQHEAEIKGRRKAGESIGDYLAANPEARLYQMANAYERQVSELRRRKRELRAKDAEAGSIKIIDTMITERMRKFNESVRRVRDREAA